MKTGSVVLRLTPAERSAAHKAILGAPGDQLLAYLRAVFFGDECDNVPHAVSTLALQLKWVACSNGQKPWLTPVGSRVADSAREYCNWLDDKRSLPAGINTQLRAEMNVLDGGRVIEGLI